MQISELFVSLGVKGSEKTIEAFAKVGTGIKNVATMSFEAKAAIIGATYALEQFMSTSAQRGTDLSNLSTYLGISTKQLQQWQYAAQQAGESGEEFTSSMKSVYDKISQMRMGKQRPEGFSIFAQNVGGFDIEKSYNDIPYVLSKLQEFAKSNVNNVVKNNVLKGFGLSENTISAMKKGVFNQPNFNKAPLYNDKEIENLAKVKVAWDNLETKVAMFFGHFTAKSGEGIVNQLSIFTDKVLLLAMAFERLIEKLKVLQYLGESAQGWEKIINLLTNTKYQTKDQQTLDKVYDAINKSDNISSISTNEDKKSSPYDFFKEYLINKTKYLNPNGSNGLDFKDILNNLFNFLPNNQSGTIAPPTPLLQNSNNTPQNTNINQNLYFQHEGKEYGQIKSSVNESIVSAWKQLSANNQAT